MKAHRILSLFVLCFAITAWAGCDGGSSGGPADDAAVDTIGTDLRSLPDTAPEDTAAPDTLEPDVVTGDDTVALEDLPPGPDTMDPPTCQGPGLMGQLVQTDDTPIGGVKLFLCGVVNGSETCNPRTADEQGYFAFENLAPGYTHLEVNATLSGVQMGKVFAGYSLAVDPSEADCVDMGLIVLPELGEGEDIVTATGGSVTIGAVTLEFPAGCPVFPDYSGEGAVGGAVVPLAESYWAPEGAVLGLALHPFKAHCDPGVTVRVDASAGLAAPSLLYNDLDHGDAKTAGVMAPDGDGWVLEAAVPDLTWIWFTD